MAKIAEMQEVSLDLIKPYERNAKIHGEDQIKMLMDSIQEFGFLSPCLIERDTFNLIAGHGRVEAAKRLGMKEVPCVFVEDISEEQRKAYILADNRLTELGEWDMALVKEELAELEEIGFDTSVTGFDISFEEMDELEEGNPYVSNANIPQYEPSGEDVDLSDLCDTSVYDELLYEIDKAGVTEREKSFLRLAAARHIVFSYKKIADYYASASEEMQKLMERSALVIIDVEDAIRYGFARLSSYLDEIEERENGE